MALAAALEADECQIWTDVDGIFTADPRIVDSARPLRRIRYDEVLEMASSGAQVIQTRAIECAAKNKVPMRVLSSLKEDSEGTLIIYDDEEYDMEKPMITGITYNRDEAKITLQRVPDNPGMASSIFSAVADRGVDVDMIIQNTGEDGQTDLSFTVHRSELNNALAATTEVASEIGAGEILSNNNIAKVAIVGVGMKSHAESRR